MYELKFKNVPLSLLILIAGIILSGLAFYFPYTYNIQIPVLLIGSFAALLIIDFILHSKATAGQLIGLVILSFVFFVLSILITLFGLKYLGIYNFTLDNLNFAINPISITVSFLASITVVKIMSNFEAKLVQKNTHVNISQETPVEQINKEEITEEVIKLEPKTEVKQEFTAPPVEDIYKKPEESSAAIQEIPQNEVFLEDTISSESENNSPELIFEEIIEENNQEITAIDNDLNQNNDKVLFEETFENFFEPDLNLEGISDQKEKSDSENSVFQENVLPQDETFEFIPENIRLVENPTSKDNDNSGKLSSIGKLLVNQRDIENIIESNAMMQAGAESGAAVITADMGDKLKVKFNTIKTNYPQVHDLAFFDKSGFIVMTTIDDRHTAQKVGAIYTNAFLTIQNYLSRINITNAEKMFFKTESEADSIIKVNEDFLFVSSDTELKQIEYGGLSDILSLDSISYKDLEAIRNVDEIINAAITDKNGRLLGSLNEESSKLAVISSAIFENLKVFISNINSNALEEIIVFTQEKVLIIKKYGENIAAFLTKPDGSIKSSHQLINIEKLVK